MRNYLSVVVGFLGALICSFLGGMDKVLATLCVVMVVDCVTGLTVALVFHTSPKSTTGKAKSNEFVKGVCKKIGMLALVGVGTTLDYVMDVSYIRYGIAIAFIASELLSLIENASLMGIPIPKVLMNALDIISEKE